MRHGVAAFVAFVLLGGAAHASGLLAMSFNSGVACQGSSGFGARAFYFGPDFARNTSDGTQYLNCAFPLVRENAVAYAADGSSGFALNGDVQNRGGSVATLVCVATASYYGVDTTVRTQAVRSLDIAAGSSAFLQIPATDLPIRHDKVNLGLNCAIPSQVQVGRLTIYQPKNF